MKLLLLLVLLAGAGYGAYMLYKNYKDKAVSLWVSLKTWIHNLRH